MGASGIVNAPRPRYTARLMMPIRCDYHLHTPRCKHATGPIAAYVERALVLGLEEMGFACHNPLPHGYGANVRMDEAELDDYVNDVLRLRDRYRGQIVVRLGLELDYVEGLEAYLAKQIADYPWDYIIGSVHYLDAHCRASSWPRNYAGDIHALYARYFELLRGLARSGLCDIIAHFDVPKRTGRAPTEPEAEAITVTLREIARANLALEINTSGYRHLEPPQPEAYPCWPIVQEALGLGIPFTVNSDAHAPDQVGLKFDEVAAALPQHGCRQLWRFAGRKRSSYLL